MNNQVSRLKCYGRFLRRWSLSWVTTRFENCFLINFFYLTLCTFSFEIKESSLSNTRCLIQDVLSPHCGDKRMARRCTRRSLLNYFDMTSYHWNETKHSNWHWWKNGKNNVTSCTKCSLPESIVHILIRFYWNVR